MVPPWLAAACAALVAAAAWRARALDTGGACAAWLVGTAILWGTGWTGGAILLAFFAPTSAVSRLAPRRHAAPLDPKGERRDAWQVLANGGVAAAAAVAGAGYPWALWAAGGALATAAADTWATAWGAGSAAPPRHLLTWREVLPGTSGGISARGTLGSLAGALVTAAPGLPTAGMTFVALVAATGVGGMLLDSLLGATVQGRFACPACGTPSEWPMHRCGTRTLPQGGIRWLTNDWVNGLATAAGGACGWLAWRCCSP